MLIIPESMDVLFNAFNACYNEGFSGVESHAKDVALVTNSQSAQEVYPWLGQFPGMREWIGDRYLKSLVAYDYFIKNKKFESTVTIPREKIEDDQYGIFAPVFKQMGRVSAQHPDKELFFLLKNGFTINCYDGRPFFDANHPSFDDQGNQITLSNIQDGTGEPWYLLDTKQPVKPMVWQVRIPYEFTTVTRPDEMSVFLRDEFAYGIRARVNAGFGFWQCAYSSRQALNAENFALARAAMAGLRGDQGQILGIEGNTLVVSANLEAQARLLLKATFTSATSNVWFESAKLIVSPFLA